MKCTLILVLTMISISPALGQTEDAGLAVSPIDSAKVLEKDKDFKEAIEIYRALLAKDPNDTGLRLKLARVLGWAGEYDSSLAAYNQLLASDPGLYEARFGVATVTSWKHDYPASLNMFKALLSEHPLNTDVLAAISRVSFWSGEQDSAISYARRALEIDPRQEEALLIAAQASAERLDFTTARSYLTRLLDINPGNEAGRRLLQDIKTQYLNKASLSFNADKFGPSNSYTNTLLSLRYDRTISYALQLFGEADSRYTFGSRDVAGVLGGSYRFSDYFSMDGSFLLAPQTSTAQREKGILEVNYNLGGGFVASGSYQYILFRGTAVNVLAPALSYYYTPDDWLAITVYFGRSNSGSSSTSFMGRTEFDVVGNLSALVGAFHGTSFYLLPSQLFLEQTATGGFLSLKYKFDRRYQLQANVNYTNWRSAPWAWSRSAGLALLYAW